MVDLISFLVLLLATFAVGSVIERRHFRDIERRELRARNIVVTTFEAIPEDWVVERAELVTGSVVISLDYFKRFLAALRGIVGGRVEAYEPLMDRARREAVLRMIEEAHGLGFRHVINVRLETSRLATGRRNGEGTAGVEVLAFGTGLKVAR